MNMEFTLTHVLPYNVTNFSENFLRIQKISIWSFKRYCSPFHFIIPTECMGNFSFKCLETTNSMYPRYYISYLYMRNVVFISVQIISIFVLIDQDFYNIFNVELLSISNQIFYWKYHDLVWNSISSYPYVPSK